MSLFSQNLLEEELYELLQETSGCSEHSYKSTRIRNLQGAITELTELTEQLEYDCSDCRYNISLNVLTSLNEEEYLNTFNKCRTCSNYYTNNFENKYN